MWFLCNSLPNSGPMQQLASYPGSQDGTEWENLVLTACAYVKNSSIPGLSYNFGYTFHIMDRLWRHISLLVRTFWYNDRAPFLRSTMSGEPQSHPETRAERQWSKCGKARVRGAILRWPRPLNVIRNRPIFNRRMRMQSLGTRRMQQLNACIGTFVQVQNIAWEAINGTP